MESVRKALQRKFGEFLFQRNEPPIETFFRAPGVLKGDNTVYSNQMLQVCSIYWFNKYLLAIKSVQQIFYYRCNYSYITGLKYISLIYA